MLSKLPVISFVTVSAIVAVCIFTFKNSDNEESQPKRNTDANPSHSSNNTALSESHTPTLQKAERSKTSPKLDKISAINEQGSDAVKAYVLDLLSKNEQEGLEFLASLEDNLDYESMGQAIYDHFILNDRHLDGLDAFKILDKNLTLATPLLHSFVSAYYHKEPKAALTWITENPHLNGIENAAHSTGMLSAKLEEPTSEIQSMLQSEMPVELRTAYLNGAMESWMDEDLDAAFQFFSTADLPKFYYDETIYLMAGKAVEVDPLGAMEWADTIINEQYRHSALSEVSRNWSFKAPDEFKHWLDKQSPKLQAEIQKASKPLE